MDFTGTMSDLKKALETRATRIRKSFPQISPAICFVHCPPSIPTQLAACWVVNHAPAICEETPTWRALLLIDPQRQQHSFCSGYELETFLLREDIEALIDRAGESFYLQDWESGAIAFLDGLYELLRTSCEFSLKAEKEARSQISP